MKSGRHENKRTISNNAYLKWWWAVNDAHVTDPYLFEELIFSLCLLWNPKVRVRGHKSPSLVPILSHLNPFHILTQPLLRHILTLNSDMFVSQSVLSFEVFRSHSVCIWYKFVLYAHLIFIWSVEYLSDSQIIKLFKQFFFRLMLRHLVKSLRNLRILGSDCNPQRGQKNVRHGPLKRGTWNPDGAEIFSSARCSQTPSLNSTKRIVPHSQKQLQKL